MPTEREPDAAVVDANPVAHLAPEQLVDGNAGGLAGDIPERHLDRADGPAPSLEASQPADLQHDPFDVGRVFTEKVLLVSEHDRLQVGLARLHLAVTADALVGHDPHDGI